MSARREALVVGCGGIGGLVAADALHAGLPKTGTLGLVILATQAGDVEAVVAEALPLIDGETRVLCLQNGLAER